MSTSKKQREEMEAVKVELEKARKELETCRSSQGYTNARNTELTQQIEHVHTFLDALPAPPAKHPEGENYRPYPLMTRLAVWMARKA